MLTASNEGSEGALALPCQGHRRDGRKSNISNRAAAGSSWINSPSRCGEVINLPS